MELIVTTQGGTQVKVQDVPPGMTAQVEKELSLLLGEPVRAETVKP